MAKQPFENVVQHLFQIAARAEFRALTDQDLLKRYVEYQDNLAFGELVRRYKGMVWYVCWRVLHHHQDVEDAFQATVMTLVRRAKSVLSYTTIEGWLHSTAFKVASAAKRDRARRHAREERSATMHREEYEGQHCRREMEEVLDKEITGIPEKLRSPLILCYLEGLSQKEAAQKLGLSIDALDQRLRRGRECLKQRLSRYGMEWSPTMLISSATPGVHAPQVPTGLVDKTLEMVRIITLSNGALETTNVSPQVAMLIKSAMGVWTLKVKLCLGVLLLAAAGIGAGVVKYPGFVLQLIRGEQPYETKPDPTNKKIHEPQTSPTPPRKDLYGDPLPEHALARMGTVRMWHRGDCWQHPLALAFSPDGKTLASQSKTTSDCILWDVATGKEIRRFEKLGPCHLVDFSLDGRTLVTTGWEKKEAARLWDVATGKLIRTYRGSKKEDADCRGMTVLPSGEILAVEEFSVKPGLKAQRIWEITTGREISQLSGPSKIQWQWWHTATFSPDGKTLAAIVKEEQDEKNFIHLWEVATGKEIRQLSCRARSVAFSHDGKALLAVARDFKRKVHFWDIVTDKEMRFFDGGTAQVAVFSPNGKTVATSDEEGAIHLWKVATGKEIGPHRGNRGGVRSLAYSPDGRTLASGSRIEGIPLWQVATGKEIRQLNKQGSGASLITYCPDGKLLAIGFGAELVGLWNAASGNKLSDIPPCEGTLDRPYAVFSSDGKLLASLSQKEARPGLWCVVASVFDISIAKKLCEIDMGDISNKEPRYWNCTFSPDGKVLAATIANDTVALCETATGAPLGRLSVKKQSVPKQEKEPQHYILGRWLSFSPDGRILFEAKEWQCENRKRQMATNATIIAWEITTGQEIYQKTLQGYESPSHGGKWQIGAVSFAFSPDGRTVAVGGDPSGKVHLWETATGEELGHLMGHGAIVNAVAFSPDGQTLASGSNDTTCLIWNIRHWTRRLTPLPTLPVQVLSQQQLLAAWNDLALRDAAKAYRAAGTLMGAAKQSIPWLQAQIQPVAPLSNLQKKQLKQWIKDLDSDRFAARTTAQRGIAQVGEPAILLLRQAVADQPALDVRRRLQSLLAKLEPKVIGDNPPQRLREMRAVQILQAIGTPEARRVLQAWAQGLPEAGLTRDAQAALKFLAKRP